MNNVRIFGQKTIILFAVCSRSKLFHILHFFTIRLLVLCGEHCTHFHQFRRRPMERGENVIYNLQRTEAKALVVRSFSSRQEVFFVRSEKIRKFSEKNGFIRQFIP